MNGKFAYYCAILMSVVALLLLITLLYEEKQWEQVIGNNRVNIESLKTDCEKDLPRYQECTLLYEFVPTKTKGEQ